VIYHKIVDYCNLCIFILSKNCDKSQNGYMRLETKFSVHFGAEIKE